MSEIKPKFDFSGDSPALGSGQEHSELMIANNKVKPEIFNEYERVLVETCIAVGDSDFEGFFPDNSIINIGPAINYVWLEYSNYEDTLRSNISSLQNGTYFDAGETLNVSNITEKTEDSGVTVGTGDILFKDEEGYYWFSGRDDDLIMASGYRISPFEVESTLISHPNILEAAVVASPDEIRGVIVKAYVILDEKQKASNELIKDIQEYSKRVSAPYKYPREIEFVDEIPKTQSGKIMRKKLRELEIKKKGIIRSV